MKYITVFEKIATFTHAISAKCKLNSVYVGNKHLRSCHLTSSFMLSSCVPWPLLQVVWILFMPGISDWDCRICFGLQVQHLVTWYVLSWKITLTSSIGGWKQGGTGVQVEATPCHPSGDMSRRFDIHFNIPMNAYHDGRITPWHQPLDSEGK